MENWKINPKGKNWIIIKDTPDHLPERYTKLQTKSHLDFYDGYLVCGDIMNHDHAKLISASPDMLDALLNLENDDGRIPKPIWDKVTSAISKALVKVEALPPVIYPPKELKPEPKFCMIRSDLSNYDFGLDLKTCTEYEYRWINDDEGFQIFFQNKWHDMNSIDFSFIEPFTPGVRIEPGLLMKDGVIGSPGMKVYQKIGDNFGKSNSVQSGILMHDDNEFYIIWDDDEDHTRCKITDASTLYLIK